MNRIAIAGLAVAALMTGTAQAAAPASAPGKVCIQSYKIDHTKAPNDKTLIFYMKDGSSYQSTLVSSCPELSIYGFSYMPTPPDEICGNLQSIRVIRTGSVCLLGPLTPIGPKTGGSY